MVSGRVAIPCQQGLSRSATLAIVYLMTRQGMTAPKALQVVKKKRPIHPNEVFFSQIAELHNKMNSKHN